MMFGVVLVGTYTSVFIASPILIYLGVGTGRDALSEARQSRKPWRGGLTADARICRRRRRSMPMAMAASASAACRIAARCCACRTASGPGRSQDRGDLTPRRLQPVLARGEALDVFLIGAGRDPWALPRTVADALPRRGVSVDAMTTGAAVRTYNILLAENRRVGAGLIAVE